MKPEWFESWFGEEYIALYPHRNAAEAEHAVQLIERYLDPSAPNRVLDLACGAGRHARVLSTRRKATGLDLSWVLLKLARRYQMSGGYIRNAALRAAFLAAEEGTPLTQHLLERAVRAEFREGGKLGESGVLE